MPELRIVGGPRNQEGAGNAGRSIAPMARLQTKKQAAVTTGTPKRSGIPCTTVFRLIRALPGDRALLPPSLRGHLAKLDPSVGGSGPHDFAGRIDAARPATSTRPSHPAPNTRDDRVAPLSWVRDAQTRTTDLPDGTRGFFATQEVTAPITLVRLPKSVFARAIWRQCTRLCTLRTRSCIPLRRRRTIRNSSHRRIRSYRSVRCTGRQSEPAPTASLQ